MDASNKGPFPEVRPLLCKEADSYNLLNDDGSLDIFYMFNQTSRVHSYDLQEEWPPFSSHTALNKYLVRKRIEVNVALYQVYYSVPFQKRDEKRFYCLHDFPTLFEDYETFPHDFKGQLPDRRPLVFENTLIAIDHNGYEIKEDHRIILHEDGTLMQYACTSGAFVEVNPCPTWCFPSILITTENLKEIIQVSWAMCQLVQIL